MVQPKFLVDAELLEARINELGAIGLDGNGQLFRPVYSESWLDARDVLAEWMRQAGLTTRVDAVGNLFGRLEGKTEAPVVLSGSHLDTVRNGGKFDGALGIHAGLAALAAIRSAHCVPDRPIEVVALCEEEGSRFPSPMWGTQAILGMVTDQQASELVDQQGVSLANAMDAVGLNPDRVHEATRSDIACFVELHIEQGGVLEAEGVPMGIVDAIVGQRHYAVTVTGRQNHGGTTPMDMRADALAAAAEMFMEIESIFRKAGRPAVATVGQVDVEPGSRNVIPGHVEFTIDTRHTEAETLSALGDEMQDRVVAIAGDRDVEVTVEDIFYRAPVPMDSRLREIMAGIAEKHDLQTKAMPSGAGHDSQLFALGVPTGMIFTPSVGGVSHSPLEFTPVADIVPCVNVLAETLWSLANGDFG